MARTARWCASSRSRRATRAPVSATSTAAPRTRGLTHPGQEFFRALAQVAAPAGAGPQALRERRPAMAGDIFGHRFAHEGRPGPPAARPDPLQLPGIVAVQVQSRLLPMVTIYGVRRGRQAAPWRTNGRRLTAAAKRAKCGR